MATDHDDVDKLLGQVKLQDFQYRAFGRHDTAPLRMVRPQGQAPAGNLNRADKIESPPGPVARVSAPPVASVMEASKPASRPATGIPVRAAFERLARVGVIEGAPRLRLKFDLPLRPPLTARPQHAAFSDRRLEEVFASLQTAPVAAVAGKRNFREFSE